MQKKKLRKKKRARKEREGPERDEETFLERAERRPERHEAEEERKRYRGRRDFLLFLLSVVGGEHSPREFLRKTAKKEKKRTPGDRKMKPARDRREGR